MVNKNISFIRLIIVAVLFLTPELFLHAEYPVSSVVMIDKREEGAPPIAVPDRLILEIFSAADTLYKLSLGENIVATGRFTMGINILSIPAEHLFTQNGSRKYTYVLEMKTGDKMTAMNIIFNVFVKFETPENSALDAGASGTKTIRYDEVSIMVAGRFIDSYLKTTNTLSLLMGLGKGKREAPPLEFDPVFFSQPKKYSASVNPLMLAYMAYKTIDSKIKKKKAEKLKEMKEKTGEISGTFRKQSSSGSKIPVELSIKLSIGS